MPDRTKALLAVLNGGKSERKPVWLMRQAGRYLPEYRALRAKKGGFLALATDPEAAAEIIQASSELYERVRRLDREPIGEDAPPSPARGLLSRLERSL